MKNYFKTIKFKKLYEMHKKFTIVGKIFLWPIIVIGSFLVFIIIALLLTFLETIECVCEFIRKIFMR